MNAQRKHNLRNTAHQPATGISSSRAILSVVEVSEEESEVKKKNLNDGRNFPILMKIINLQTVNLN